MIEKKDSNPSRVLKKTSEVDVFRNKLENVYDNPDTPEGIAFLMRRARSLGTGTGAYILGEDMIDTFEEVARRHYVEGDRGKIKASQAELDEAMEIIRRLYQETLDERPPPVVSMAVR